MTHARVMLETTLTSPHFDRERLARCIDACFDCAQACAACADACLAEEGVAGLRRCISLDLLCADVCIAAAATLSRQVGADDGAYRALVVACAKACAGCASECEQHAVHHQHCRVCAEVCRACEACCLELVEAA